MGITQIDIALSSVSVIGNALRLSQLKISKSFFAGTLWVVSEPFPHRFTA